MSVDLSQFHQVFFEESFESLDVMEASLMELNPNAIDAEVINCIFRSAHSIKGGSGTFGFDQIAQFTHVLETLLEEIRSGKRGIVQDDIDLYLQSVDCLRDMLRAAQSHSDYDQVAVNSVQQQFQNMLAKPAHSAAAVAAKKEVAAPAPEKPQSKSVPTTSAQASEPPKSVVESNPNSGANTYWQVDFKPQPEILRTGNEPARMFRELQKMGAVEVVVGTDLLPSFGSMEPELCYLHWQINIHGDVQRGDILEVFEWVADEAEITITQVQEAATQNETTVATVQTPSATPSKSTGEGSTKETNSIRVAIDKIDNLINMVGELVITQSMLGQIGSNFDTQQLPRLLEGLSQLEHNTRELQESVMRIRMMPISFSFSRFPRMVRDLSSRLGKNIDLVLMGEQTELDKTVMERIGDPLVHLVRNAVDHGIEVPEVRRQAGKSATGKIILNAYHQSGNVVIEIIDDGKGLSRAKLIEKALSQNLVNEVEVTSLSDAQVYDFIFHPGFSTAAQVSDVSGRGVGMDVVKRNIQALNGTVDIKSSEGVGTTITIRLPLTLAILDGQLVRVGSNTYIFPLVSIVESMQVDDAAISEVAGGCQVFKLRHEYVPVIRLYEVFNVKPDSYLIKDSLLVVVEHDGEKVGIVVDELAAQQQVVIKSLEQNYKRIEGVSGATILGDGTVSLILDVPGIVKLAGVRHHLSDKRLSDKRLSDQLQQQQHSLQSTAMH